ncbi:uncharacterized protein LOC114169328 [Vigna unguiculata]|uniref:Uncharacterized protein n=1 Tax=Vigna unguiculata TaxID=3917 RepID=A0A4D6LCD8_VIGUN|nr:uncharacterized protein LOC114169328 [Vigna unguiculata]QCD86242.1 hypothetical protein DEO72_LG3g763 [Vigna unguiculata]
MTNPIESEISDEAFNPSAAEQCRSKDPSPSQKSPPTVSQSPQTETLTLPDPDPRLSNPNQDHDSMMREPIPIVTVDDTEPDDAEPNIPGAAVGGGGANIRRSTKKKKMGNRRTAKERKWREKIPGIVETLKPIPFTPAKTLDFEKHQSLLKRLGLWEFVNVEFDSALRADLLAQLIASYVPNYRCGYVNGFRINVSRADLGRALKLPKKNVGAAAVAAVVDDSVDLNESIAFVEELAYHWMLLPYDACMMTGEILGWLDLIKEGNFEKMDWAGMIWCMVEKELRAPQLVSCYYASHLQLLIKTQHKELYEEGVEVGEEENEVKEEGEEEDEDEEGVKEEVDGSGDVKMDEVDGGQVQELEGRVQELEGQVQELEEHHIELSLGQDNNVEKVEVEKEQGGQEQMMDFEQVKDVEEPGMWLMDQKSCVEEPFLRPCHGDLKGLHCEQLIEDEGEDGQQEEEGEEEEEDGEEDEHEGGFHLSPKCIPMEGIASGNGLQVMDAGQLPFGSGIDLRDNPVGDFLSSRDEPQMISGSSLFGNGHKRDSLALDNHNSHHSLNGSNKRLRSDSPWNTKPMDFETCMEQMEHWMGKARMMYATKDQACEESTMNQQLLMDELQKRDNLIEHLHKAKFEESQKRQMEVYRFEKELYMMQSLVDGYRKALKETRKAFTEYRARYPQGDEPLYADVPGSGGLVLTVMEVEKERLKKEAEERAKLRDFMIEFDKNCTDFESQWSGKFEAYLSRVESLNERFLALEEKMKQLNEVNTNRKVSDPVESAPTTEGETA